MSDDNNSDSSHSSAWRPLILMALVATVLVGAYYFEVGEKLQSLRGWIDSLGYWGPVVYILIYAGAVVAALPGSAMTVIAGALFGSLIGVIIVSIASTLGAALSFLLARYLARDSVENWLSGKEKFQELDKLTREHGAIIVALTRLVPVFPFNLLNYGFGLTRIPFWTYVFWSWLCMIPGTILYVVGTDAVTRALQSGEIPWLLILITAAALAVLFALVRVARSKLQEKKKEAT